MKNKTSILVRTRHFFYVLLIAVIFCGCELQTQKQVERYIMEDPDFEIVVIDGCEYVVFDRAHGSSGGGGICHKQNCKYCAERSKK